MDLFSMRVTSLGVPVWTRTFGDIYDESGYGIAQVSSGYVAIGRSSSFDAGMSSDAILIMLDHGWNVLLTWKTGASPYHDRAQSVAPVPGGGCVTAGIGWTYGSGTALTQYDNNGTTCVGEQVNLQETIVTPEVGGLNGAFTFVEPIEMFPEPTVKFPGLNDSTVCRAPVLCGDADLSGTVDIDDIVYIVAYIFDGGPLPDPVEAGDADCSGLVDIDDVVFLVNFVFSAGNYPCDTDGDGNPDC